MDFLKMLCLKCDIHHFDVFRQLNITILRLISIKLLIFVFIIDGPMENF